MASPIVSVMQFTRRFPEFRDTDAGLLQEVLLEAEARVDPDVWGTKRELGIKALAAHLVATGPMGEPAKLISDEKTTIYEKAYKRLQRTVTLASRNT